jgi:glycosyltransferase involved in cell wall biosynthesis
MIDKSVILSDAEFLSKMESKRKREFYTITYISNFIESKGYDDLVEAIFLIPISLRKRLKVQFVGAWVDRESKKENFLKRISQSEVKETIQYIGPVYNREHIKKLLSDSDIFCLPTYYPVEAQPLCIIEAMNAGMPVITTNHASIPDYIMDGDNGFLVNKKAPGEIADAIKKLANTECWTIMALNARRSFEENFSYQKYKDKVYTLFELKHEKCAVLHSEL